MLYDPNMSSLRGTEEFAPSRAALSPRALCDDGNILFGITSHVLIKHLKCSYHGEKRKF